MGFRRRKKAKHKAIACSMIIIYDDAGYIKSVSMISRGDLAASTGRNSIKLLSVVGGRQCLSSLVKLSQL